MICGVLEKNQVHDYYYYCLRDSYYTTTNTMEQVNLNMKSFSDFSSFGNNGTVDNVVVVADVTVPAFGAIKA